jgi:starch synthase (maltosyl-transferring)
VNRIRRENPALQGDLSLHFHSIDNEQLICYSKRTEDRSNVVLVVVNLDYRYKQSGWVDLCLEELGLSADRPYQVRDLLADTAYQWRGSRNYVELDPQKIPAHVFQVERGADKET